MFPISGDPAPTYEDPANGYSVTAAAGNIVFIDHGLAADQVAPAYSLNPGEQLGIVFYENDMGSLGATSSVQNLEVFFIRLAGVELTFQATNAGGGSLGPRTSTAASGSVDISALYGDVPLSAISIAATGPVGAQVTIPSMQYDHDCL